MAVQILMHVMIEYTCSSGTSSPTPATSDCTDNVCASGYNVNNSACEAQCTLTAQTGLAPNTNVDSGSSSQSRDCEISDSLSSRCGDHFYLKMVVFFILNCPGDIPWKSVCFRPFSL